MFAVRMDKPSGFVGRDAVARQRAAGILERLVQFVLEDPGQLLDRSEPVWRDDANVAYVRSAMYRHTRGGAVGLGYVEGDGVGDDLSVLDGCYAIEVAGVRYAARALIAALYDPGNAKIRCSFRPARDRRLHRVCRRRRGH